MKYIFSGNVMLEHLDDTKYFKKDAVYECVSTHTNEFTKVFTETKVRTIETKIFNRYFIAAQEEK